MYRTNSGYTSNKQHGLNDTHDNKFITKKDKKSCKFFFIDLQPKKIKERKIIVSSALYFRKIKSEQTRKIISITEPAISFLTKRQI